MCYYKNRSNFLLKLILLVSITMILPNCASKQAAKLIWDKQPNSLLQRAQAALSAEQFAIAAQLFTQLANINKPSLKNRYVIAAIDAHLKSNNSTHANELINLLLNRTSELTPFDKLALADILLKQSKVGAVSNLLISIEQSKLTVNQRIDLHKLNSSAFFQAGNLIESSRERVLLDSLIKQPSKKLNNQTKLVETLSLLSQQALELLRPTVNNNMMGWIDLAIILRQQVILDQNSIEVSTWKKQHPSHTANNGYLSDSAQQTLVSFDAAKNIGVFLPTQGTYAHAASSIKKGITASAYATADRRAINIIFYDTSSTPIKALYHQAINDSVDVIIGPLDKTNTAQIASINDLSIPVISLNKNDAHHSKNYYEFSLSPEEDATQVLSLAWLKGHEKALILTPQSRYGKRLANHFSNIWQRLGGEILEVQNYSLKQADYSVPIKNLLQLDESLNRFRQLRQRLNLDIQFEARRRHDADFIFLIAAPREGRLIKPQLRFHHAENMPVFSTSKIYEGELNKVANRDLDGIYFCDMAWLIEPKNNMDANIDSALQLWPNARGLHRRLMAFGYDAHQLVPHLKRLKSNDFSHFRGKTGILSMNKKGQINRQLSCGRFKRGVVTSLGLAPRLERALNMPSSYSIEQTVDRNTAPL
ncbi:MAG: LppC family lipoprotein [Cycloclasticus sp. symbiont of Poecilosclerida sp. N]|nr:MAG: LppC family lipoprotein [Cycloclasticus sp. symbiont of Poecilosclerida sp. N]